MTNAKRVAKVKAAVRAITKNLRVRRMRRTGKRLYVVTNEGAGAWEVGSVVVLAKDEKSAMKQAAGYMKRKYWGDTCEETGPDSYGVVYVDCVDP